MSRTDPNTPLAEMIASSEKFQSGPQETLRAALVCCEGVVDREFENFSKACEAEGWSMNEHVLRVDQWRIDWREEETKRVD